VLVCDPFEPALVRAASFYGLVRIGVLRNVILGHHDFSVPAGIRNSTLVSCDVGDDVSIQDCSLISRYIIGDRCILSRIDEMAASNHAKFGWGVVKDGEDESVRVWIDVMNEAGGRSVLPFAGMIPADAYLWAAYRDDTKLAEKLKEITQGDNRYRGWYGTVGNGTVIKSCRIIKDTAVGEGAYIKGANKLKNLSILSSEDEAAQIGEGVELVNGIIGYGSHVFYGSKAVRFVLGNRCNLKYGARLIHSVLGDNSTISCCEILNNLVFPVHEQHHNNSFLIAGLIEGMSNMAAGATVGSNHNSRANDGEIRAGRGFWPGLSVTLKHSSRFASFCLIVKGDYPYELNIPLPFALVNNNVRRDRLEVMPAYFWMYNLYALERNSWKTVNRDRRSHRLQRIDSDYLAPDTAEEIIAAMELIRSWMAAAGIPENPAGNYGAAQAAEAERAGGGEDVFLDPEYDYTAGEEVLPASGLERHDRPGVILKFREALEAYRNMLFFYGMKTLTDYFLETRAGTGNGSSFEDFTAELEQAGEDLKGTGGRREWINLGGQIVPAFRVDALRRDIGEGRVADWEAVHRRYGEMAGAYPKDRARHAWSVLARLRGGPPGRDTFREALEQAASISGWIREQVFISRAKDFHDPFRGITYRNQKEMDQVAGRVEDNSFVRLAEENHRRFTEKVRRLRGML
ncbi:MAG: DUF4954 family protein, partial [Spirochaetaceae bacterium]|jgi:NDP-sugar pyrophosphorylase family protein|nr:DUF4954 family protein [Spirochaetaceae bacterium]